MVNLEKLAATMKIAFEDKEKNIEVLKQALRDNGFKLCAVSADIMLGEMSDLGLEPDAVNYYRTLALAHLPYAPQDALQS